MQKKFLWLVLGLYLVSAIGSFGAFSYFVPTTTMRTSESATTDDVEEPTLLASLLTINPSDPRDQACPLNGAYYTQQERAAWEKRRPLAVMIENSPDARPQSGLSQADVMFEVMAEGGVTRFMGIFYCGVQANDTILAPVRSARTYFVDYASGFNLPLYVHVGGANLDGPADALGQISQYGWALENDLNQFSIGYPTFVRNGDRLKGKEVATEHTMQSSTELLWEVADERSWTNLSPERKIGRKVVAPEEWSAGFTPWTFSDEAVDSGSVTKIAYEFWTGFDQFAVEWQYDTATNMYQRVMAGEPHIDLNSGKQIAAANVVVLLTTEKGPINELKHMLYTTTGTGKALIFHNGEAITAKWNKKTRESQLRFTDSAGKDVPLARGLTWISIVDTTTEVTY
ncbi:MAG: hypothetical protein A2632_01695 [Candidatus Pacebacteria bacterium RIFCSPHIGHO2_01_FULL_46_16]|nr:MAG: hypothetical protein A2632_01695 [Candidatus Pacebacteria bacterium RIFCSPHIGHO2_01_FULL_46_16]OGJ21791.1 MAG: hypothetical protein A3J60_02890 [Candidatus Pacebacteria bacterium RIFCSPHIGHO2_02_FULL_46_9]